MKTILLCVFLGISLNTFSQTGAKKQAKARLTSQSIVKDSTGRIYSYIVWQVKLLEGDCKVRPLNPENINSEFLIQPTTAAEKELALARKEKMKEVKPKESEYFTTGDDFKFFSSRDIKGNRFKVADLKGKVVVINFWFINCAPCRKEIPELNAIVKEYANNKNVVFLAVALDDENDINDFLSKNAFDYNIVGDGRSIAQLYGIKSYPTNIVIDAEGKIKFHGSGYTLSTAYWIKKTIDEAVN